MFSKSTKRQIEGRERTMKLIKSVRRGLICSHFEESGAFMWTTIASNRDSHFNLVDFRKFSNQGYAILQVFLLNK